MKLLQERKIKIGDRDYSLKMTNRAMMEFEEISGHSISIIETLRDITIMLYCCLKAGDRKEFALSYEEFLDLIDEEASVIKDFTDIMLDPVSEEKKM
jgi:hypothetical protein